ncbi:Fic family protein [Candidatus Magnetobacterium casensis]|uniref:protein adenylyltransferase n=2 Tax=Candidatus Magnetobacterium casense TaxID=1455061 RepID=A0ABS6RZL8_9BACT|nr:Fic family protein [Candidatus Magnetobacterium casensis]
MIVTPVSKYSDSDHYTDAATGILKNRLGITTKAELEKAEACFAGTRSYELSQNPLKGNFDLEHLKAIHGYIFKDLYEWAGQCRDINIAKGDNLFAHHIHIEAAAKLISDKLAKEKHLAGLSKANFCKRAAFYLGELNALHPFREGNGRTQREFISHLAYANGYYIEWKNVSQDDMTQAGIASFQHGDCSGFLACIQVNIRDF